MQKQKKTLEQLMTRQREINDSLASIEDVLLKRELNDEEKGNQSKLLAEYETNKREISLAIQEKQAAAVAVAPKKDVNTELREFFREAKPGSKFVVPVNRESISYGEQQGGFGGTDGYVQGITVVDLIPTDRPDGDILATAGVPMTTGVQGNKIQWAFAGGVEAVFANELAATTERVIDLDKQVPIQQRLTVRVRISNQALENSTFDLQSYIVRVVADSIRKKINFALASTTKATETFFGPFAQTAESGTYGQDGYTPGKQVGTYTTFTKETAAAMIGKLANRNLDTDNLVFVMGASDFWKLKVTPFDAGSGIMLIGNDNRLLGIPVVPNNAINRSTEKGALSGHNIGLGNFKYVPTMQHGNIRLSIDATSAVASNTDEVYTTINADFSMTVLKAAADAFVVYSMTGAGSASDV
jgi:HK97 family phage major capsid protein